MKSTNLTINGHHLEVTQAIRDYITKRFDRVTRHLDSITGVIFNLSVEPLKHRAEVIIRVPGRELFCEAVEDDLYAAIDALADKADRLVIKHKTKQNGRNQGQQRRQQVA